MRPPGRIALTLDRPPPPGAEVGVAARVLLADGRTEERAAWGTGARAVLDLGDLAAEGAFLLEARPVLRDAGGAVRQLPAGPLLDLADLLPLERDAAVRRFFQKATRARDPDTLLFVLQQVLRAPHAAGLERLQAAKVLAYRAMEAADEALMAEAVAHVDGALVLADGFSSRRGLGKENRTHATLSLLYVRAQLLLLLGDWEGCRRALERLRSRLAGVRRSPTAAPNAALALALLGWIEWRAGDETEALRTWAGTVALFRRAAQAYPVEPARVFGELKVPLAAARFAAGATEAIRVGRAAEAAELAPGHVARTLLRLAPGAGRDAAERVLAGITPSAAVARRGRRGAGRLGAALLRLLG